MKSSDEKKGIIYCRVSSPEQVGNTSLDSQERNCRDYAKREGIEIGKVFIEKGESAKTTDRKEFIKAIDFCTNKKNKISHFIVYKIDRFSRSQVDHFAVQAALKRNDVLLRSVTEPIDDSPIGRAMEGMASVFAEFDNNVRSERSKAGMQERLRKGVWVWGAPIGYFRKYKGANLSPDPDVAPYVAMAFEEWAKGVYTYKSLAEYLCNKGFKTRTGKIPSPQLMEKILKNPLYCGLIRTWGEEYEGAFKPIVSRELFERCQKGGRAVSVNRSKNNPEFPLRRICACSECGKSMTGSVSTGRGGVKYSYYHHHKQTCPKALSIPKEVFEQRFVEYLDSISPNRKFEKVFRAVVVDIWQSNYKKLDEDNQRVRGDIDRLEKDRQKVFDLHRSGKYSDEEFIEQKSVINQSIYHKRQLLEDNHVEEFDMEEALNYCFEFVKNTSKTWLRLKESNHELLMRFQKQLFSEKIVFDGEKFGNTELSPIYALNQGYDGEKSNLVSPEGIEPPSGS